MKSLKLSNLFQSEIISFILLTTLFLSFGFGSSIINLVLLLMITYFFLNYHLIKFDFLDKFLLFFGLYLLLISLLNLDYFVNHFLFLKFILLSLSMKFILSQISEKYLKNFIIICSFFLFFLILDIFYQKIFGADIFGFNIQMGERLSGPFNKLIPGSLILYLGFYFFLNIYFNNLNSSSILKNFIGLIILFIFVTSILITGERMNFISCLFSVLLIFFLTNNKKRHSVFVLISFLLCLFIILKDNYLYARYEKFILLLKPELNTKYFHKDEILSYKKENQILNDSEDVEDIKLSFFDTTWGAHYLTAYELFKKKPIFGNGIKSFRDLCGDVQIKSVRGKFRCSTHPHNIHLEVLSEIGLIGYLIFIILIFTILYEAIKIIINKKKYSEDIIFLFFSASLILLVTLIFPIKSSGRLSSTFFGSIYWINFSILYASIYFLKKKYSLNLEKK